MNIIKKILFSVFAIILIVSFFIILEVLFRVLVILLLVWVILKFFESFEITTAFIEIIAVILLLFFAASQGAKLLTTLVVFYLIFLILKLIKKNIKGDTMKGDATDYDESGWTDDVN